MQTNPNRDRTNVGENNLRIVEDRQYFKRARFCRNGGRKPRNRNHRRA